MNELKTLAPCPFCGKPADKEIHGSPFDWWVVCSNSECAAEGPMREEQDYAIAAWNTRPEEAAAVAETKKRAVEIVRIVGHSWPSERIAEAIEEMER